MEEFIGFSYTKDYTSDFEAYYKVYYGAIVRKWNILSESPSPFSMALRNYLHDRTTSVRKYGEELLRTLSVYDVSEGFEALTEKKSITTIIKRIAEKDSHSIRKLKHEEQWDKMKSKNQRVFTSKMRTKTLAKLYSHYHFLITILKGSQNQWLIFMDTYSQCKMLGYVPIEVFEIAQLHPLIPNPPVENTAQSETDEATIPDDQSTPDTSTHQSNQWQKAIAMRHILDALEAKNPDNYSARGRFLEFFDAGSAKKLRQKFSFENEKNRKIETRISDRRLVMDAFNDVGLNELCAKVEEEIDKLE